MVELIKKLREQTGAGILDCQNAIKESGGDYAEAVRILRENGQQIAGKKSSRAASEGLVGALDNESGILIIELNCETDFVSRGDKFKALLETVLSAANSINAHDRDSVLNAKAGSATVQELINENIAVIGENIKLGQVVFVKNDGHTSGIYVHNAVADKPNFGVIISVVVVKTDKPSAADSKELARKIAMHVAASMPLSLSIEEVDPKMIEEERSIAAEQLKESNKPEQVIKKIIDGKIAKFFEETVLLEQPSIFDTSLKIKDMVKQEAKAFDATVEIASFVRLKLGDFKLEQN